MPTTAHQASRLRDIQDIRHLLLGLPSHLRFHLHAEDASRHLLVLLSKKGEEAGIVPVQRDATAKAYARQVHEGQGEEHGQNTPFGVRDWFLVGAQAQVAETFWMVEILRMRKGEVFDLRGSGAQERAEVSAMPQSELSILVLRRMLEGRREDLLRLRRFLWHGDGRIRHSTQWFLDLHIMDLFDWS